MESTIQRRSETTNLLQKWNNLKKDHPKLRTKDVAGRLGVTEAELVASACDGETVVRLEKEWEAIFKKNIK